MLTSHPSVHVHEGSADANGTSSAANYDAQTEQRNFLLDSKTHPSTSSLRATNRRNESYLSTILWWLPELVSSLMSLLCLAGISVLAYANIGVPLAMTRRPTGLTLNATLAILSTLNKSLLLVPTSSAIMQDLWLWYSKRGSGRISKLRNLDVADLASRGPRGSMSLLFHYRGRRPWACLGAFITVASIFFGPSVQQLLSFDHIVENKDATIFEFPATNRAALPVETDFRLGRDIQDVPYEFTTSVYSGILDNSVQPLQLQCVTTNCTWPLIRTLAICGECVDMPVQLAGPCETSGCSFTVAAQADPITTGIDRTVNDTYKAIYGTAFYSLASSPSVKEQPVDRVFRLSKEDLQFTDQGKGFQISPMTTLSLFGVPPRDGDFKLDEMISKQCKLSFCIQSHQTTITNGQQSQHISTEPQHLTWNSTSNVGSLDLDAYTNSSFTVDIVTWYTMQEYLTNQLNGSIEITLRGSGLAHSAPVWHRESTGTAFMMNIWNATEEASSFIDGLATSITNYLRSTGPSANDTLGGGSAFELGVSVNWYWLVLPAVLTGLSITLLGVTMTRTRHSDAPPWKISLLQPMLIEMDESVRNACQGQMNKHHAVEKAVGDSKVELVENSQQEWRFKVV